MRLPFLILAGAVLVGCQGSDEGVAEGASPAADEPKSTEPFFVGAWAAEKDMCDNAAWEFTSSRISTPGHVVCNFENMDETSGVYNVDATCTAEGPPESYQLRISYAESAKALMVEGGPFQPIGLVACE